jgi:hypothetical protein
MMNKIRSPSKVQSATSEENPLLAVLLSGGLMIILQAGKVTRNKFKIFFISGKPADIRLSPAAIFFAIEIII